MTGPPSRRRSRVRATRSRQIRPILRRPTQSKESDRRYTLKPAQTSRRELEFVGDIGVDDEFEVHPLIELTEVSYKAGISSLHLECELAKIMGHTAKLRRICASSYFTLIYHGVAPCPIRTK